MNNSNGNPNSNVTSSLPCLVSIPPITLSRRRRLSAATVEPRRPISFSKPMAWINLEGRVVNADEASSARIIGGGLSDELAFSWDLFPPIHRFLIVAVIGAAAAQSKKDREIFNLKKSVELRDQLLSSMQEKLDNLCEQFNSSKENTVAAINKLSTKDGELQLDETFGSERFKFVDCGCWHCDEHSSFCNEYMQGALSRRASSGNEVLQYKSPFSNEDQEERRMSGLSDLASSVTSAADIQFNNLAVEQDVYNLKRDCEEKKTTIKELTTLLNSSEVANSKRVSELEDIIRWKNATISKLKKDLVVLEQKVMQLSRLRRPSFSASISNEIQLPQMRDNLIYDMDSTTSPSSSDSDSSPVNVQDLPVDVIMPIKSSESTIDQTSTPKKILNSSGKLNERRSKFRSASPLKEIPSYQKSNAASSSSQKQLSPRKDLKKSRRRSLNGTKSASANKRWV